jgi:hypothetical protein
LSQGAGCREPLSRQACTPEHPSGLAYAFQPLLAVFYELRDYVALGQGPLRSERSARETERHGGLIPC